MYCSKCGNLVESGNSFCNKCGNHINTDPHDNKNKVNISFLKKKKFIIPITIILTGVIIYLIVFNIGKNNLSKKLLGEWRRIESDDITYILELDFDESTIQYNFISTYLNSEITTFNYKVISPNKIKIGDEIIKIEFNEELSTMTVTPSITDDNEEEYWIHFD